MQWAIARAKSANPPAARWAMQFRMQNVQSMLLLSPTNCIPYPLIEWSIPETDVDQVVAVESIGDPNGIVSGTTKITRDPVGLLMAMTAVDVIKSFRSAEGRLLVPDGRGRSIPCGGKIS